MVTKSREQNRKRIHSTGPFFENQDKEWINIVYTYKMCIYIYIYIYIYVLIYTDGENFGTWLASM